MEGGQRGHGKLDKYCRRVPFLVASNSPRVAIGHIPLDDPGSQLDVLTTIIHSFNGGSGYRFPLQVQDQGLERKNNAKGLSVGRGGRRRPLRIQ